MSRTERREFATGALATLVIVAILIGSAMANRRSEGATGAFQVTAAFVRVDGINVGSPVRVAGMEIGKVAKMRLDEQNRAVLTLEFPQALDLSEDSSAAIQTDGLFGSKFVEVQPGGAEDLIKSGGRISYVQDSVILEDLIATIVARAKALRGEP